METKLLDRGLLNRIMSEDDAHDALFVLAETEYSNFLSDVENVYEFEDVLNKELERVYDLLFELAPDRRLLEFITLRGDIQNFKVLFKSGGDIKADSNLFTTRCEVEPEKLLEAYEEKRWDRLPEFFEQVALRVEEKTRIDRENQQLIDIILDKIHYERAYELAGELSSKLIIEFYEHKIDFLNIEIFIRSRAMDQDLKFMKEALVDGGNIEKSLFEECFEENISALADRLKMTDYNDVVRDGIETWKKNNSLSRYETLSQDYLMRLIHKAKLIFFGPEPLFSYLWAKETEIKNLRIILTGKINNLPESSIEERINELYV
jgi:V/A-type H+-transporting ATPase subunit C